MLHSEITIYDFFFLMTSAFFFIGIFIGHGEGYLEGFKNGKIEGERRAELERRKAERSQ